MVVPASFSFRPRRRPALSDFLPMPSLRMKPATAPSGSAAGAASALSAAAGGGP